MGPFRNRFWKNATCYLSKTCDGVVTFCTRGIPKVIAPNCARNCWEKGVQNVASDFFRKDCHKNFKFIAHSNSGFYKYGKETNIWRSCKAATVDWLCCCIKCAGVNLFKSFSFNEQTTSNYKESWEARCQAPYNASHWGQHIPSPPPPMQSCFHLDLAWERGEEGRCDLSFGLNVSTFLQLLVWLFYLCIAGFLFWGDTLHIWQLYCKLPR